MAPLKAEPLSAGRQVASGGAWRPGYPELIEDYLQDVGSSVSNTGSTEPPETVNVFDLNAPLEEPAGLRVRATSRSDV